MRKAILFYCISMIFLFSCSVLSESQLKNINTFATAAKNYSNFPGEVVKKSQELHYNNNILEASAIPDSTQIIRSLDKAKAQFEKGVGFSKKMDVSLQLIQKYAALLAQLSSGSFTDDLGKNAKELSGELNNAVGLFNDQFSTQIPDKVGKGISQIITIIGDRVIKNKQSKALKNFIPIGDTIIQLTADNLVSALDSDLKPLIESYKATFQIDFKTIIFNHIDKIDYNMLRFYIKTNSDYEDVELLRKRCIHAAEKMASSHKELKENIMKKKNLRELLSETKAFITDVKELYGILNKLFTNA
jgi:hypothetical protein